MLVSTKVQAQGQQFAACVASVLVIFTAQFTNFNPSVVLLPLDAKQEPFAARLCMLEVLETQVRLPDGHSARSEKLWPKVPELLVELYEDECMWGTAQGLMGLAEENLSSSTETVRTRSKNQSKKRGRDKLDGCEGGNKRRKEDDMWEN